jgi:cob(I)alamin adenosyltransferase
MISDDYQKKSSVVVVFTGENKGKTSAAIGLMARALGADFKVAFVQFIKSWEVSEHKFIKKIMPIYQDKLDFYKGGLGFYHAGELSSAASDEDHRKEAKKTYDFAYKAVKSGEYQLVICDEINNAVHDGLLSVDDLRKLITDKNSNTSLCLTGRNFPTELLDLVDIATDMTKLKHHYDDKVLANEGIDY